MGCVSVNGYREGSINVVILYPFRSLCRYTSFCSLLAIAAQLTDGPATLIARAAQLTDGLAVLIARAAQLTDGLAVLIVRAAQLTDGLAVLIARAAQLTDGPVALIEVVHYSLADGAIVPCVTLVSKDGH